MSVKIPFSPLVPELRFTSSRSSGPGGQHVNKVETRVTLRWDIKGSHVLTEDQKGLLLEKWATKINASGEILIHADQFSSQLKNKALTLFKLEKLLNKATYQPKARKPTKPTKAAIAKRILTKKKQGEKKQWRKRL